MYVNVRVSQLTSGEYELPAAVGAPAAAVLRGGRAGGLEGGGRPVTGRRTRSRPRARPRPRGGAPRVVRVPGGGAAAVVVASLPVVVGGVVGLGVGREVGHGHRLHGAVEGVPERWNKQIMSSSSWSTTIHKYSQHMKCGNNRSSSRFCQSMTPLGLFHL